MRAPIAAAAAAVGLLLLLPGTALGSDVSIAGKTLKVNDPANVAQNQTVGYNGATGNFELDDGGGPMTAVAPCITNLAGDAVRCPAAGITRIQVLGNGGIDDIVIQAAVPTSVRTLLAGGAGNDALNGGAGSDLLDGGDDADTFDGGGGVDTVSYASRPAIPSIRVQIGGGPVSGNSADGPAGARDRITGSVEGVIGTPGNDVVIGDGSANLFKGGDGRDKMAGKGGPDRLFGGLRQDFLRGGAGPDRLVGDGGADFLNGQDGADRLFAVDGLADAVINCGNGNGEFAAIDALDPAPVSC